MNKKMAAIIAIALVVLLVFGCTQGGNNTTPTDSNGANVSPNTDAGANNIDPATEAANSMITDDDSANIGEMI